MDFTPSAIPCDQYIIVFCYAFVYAYNWFWTNTLLQSYRDLHAHKKPIVRPTRRTDFEYDAREKKNEKKLYSATMGYYYLLFAVSYAHTRRKYVVPATAVELNIKLLLLSSWLINTLLRYISVVLSAVSCDVSRVPDSGIKIILIHSSVAVVDLSVVKSIDRRNVLAHKTTYGKHSSRPVSVFWRTFYRLSLFPWLVLFCLRVFEFKLDETNHLLL